MLRAICSPPVCVGLWLCLLTLWRGDEVHALIEIVEEQQCHDQEFRLTCRELETHMAVLEAWYTSIEDLAQNTTAIENQTADARTLSPIDAELDQVFVYSSPKHNGFYEITNRSVSENSTQWSSDVNITLDSNSESLDFAVDIVNSTESCGVERYIKSLVSWKQGDRKAPSVVREASINLRAPVSYRCTGVNHCSFRVEEDYPPAVSWSPGVVYIKYACFDESNSVHYCNREVTVGVTGAESEGYVRTPGYPHFYIGDECRWKLVVHPEQHLRLTFLDVSLRSIGPFESECTDYVTVIDSNGEVLLSSCDQVELPYEIVSSTSSVEIIVIAKSKGAFPKRGVLLHYKSINCITIAAPSSGYLVYRNEQLAHYVCNVNHVFADTRKRARIAWCYDDNRWNDSVPSCVEGSADEAVAHFVPEAPKKDAKLPPTEANMIVDIVIPSLLIAALFIGNAFIVLIIYKYRKRKNEDLEDEFNTIPLSINGNIHNAGNAV